MVVDSFNDDPVQLRPPRYSKKSPASVETTLRLKARRIMLVVSEGHQIHHVRERGYVESPVRIDSILAEIDKTDFFVRVPTEQYPEKFIRDVHNGHLVGFIKKVSREIDPASSLYPYVFPVRHPDRPPREFWVTAGYYCIDTFTPLSRYTYQAARRAVNCALTAADLLLQGEPLAYALVRPPGPPCRKPRLRGILLLQFRRRGRPIPVAVQQGRHPGPGLSPRQRPAGDLLPAQGRSDRFAARRPLVRLSVLQRFPQGKGRGGGAGLQPQHPPAGKPERRGIPHGAEDSPEARGGFPARIPGHPLRGGYGQGRPHRHLELESGRLSRQWA